MLLSIPVALLYLFRRTFFRLFFQLLWLLAFVFLIAHNKLLKIVSVFGNFTKLFTQTKLYLFLLKRNRCFYAHKKGHRYIVLV